MVRRQSISDNGALSQAGSGDGSASCRWTKGDNLPPLHPARRQECPDALGRWHSAFAPGATAAQQKLVMNMLPKIGRQYCTKPKGQSADTKVGNVIDACRSAAVGGSNCRTGSDTTRWVSGKRPVSISGPRSSLTPAPCGRSTSLVEAIAS
jgi:hypothetical protein